MINAEFKSHLLNEEGLKKAERIAQAFDTLLFNLENDCMTGREFSIAKTKMEEACFFAKKAMAINPENQKTI